MPPLPADQGNNFFPSRATAAAMPRLGKEAESLVHVRTFEFLLPQAFTISVFCRSDEESKEVLGMAAAVARLGKKLFP